MKKRLLAIIFLLTVIFSNYSFVSASDCEEEECGDIAIDTYEVSPYYSDSVIKFQYGITENSSKWDPRPYGLVSSVKSQGELGLCWDYAIQASAESYLITHNIASNTIDLSELYCAACYYSNNNYDKTFKECCIDNPGYNEVQYVRSTDDLIYLALESNYPLKDNPKEDDITAPPADLSNYSYKINRAYKKSPAFINDMKNAIITYGGGVVSFFTNAYTGFCINTDDNKDNYLDYFPSFESATGGHAVEVVGWNDNYKDGKGYWLCKNSWGKDDYKSGYLWIPYSAVFYDSVFFEVIPANKSISIQTSNITVKVGESIDIRNYIPACEDIGTIGTELKKVSDYIYIPQYPGNQEIYVYEEGQDNLIGVINVTVPAYIPIKKELTLYYKDETKTEINKYLPANVKVYEYEGNTSSWIYGTRVINVYGGDCSDRKFKLGEFTVNILPKTELTTNANKTHMFTSSVKGNYPIDAILDDHSVIEDCEVTSNNLDVATITWGDKRFLYQLKGCGETKITVTHKSTGKKASFTVKVTQTAPTLDLTIYKTEIKDNETTSIWYNSNKSDVTWESSIGSLKNYGGDGLATYVMFFPGTVTEKTDAVITFIIPGTDVKKSVTVTVNPTVVTPAVDPSSNVTPAVTPVVTPAVNPTPIVTPTQSVVPTTTNTPEYDVMPPIAPRTSATKSEPGGKFTYKDATIKLDIANNGFTVYGGTSIPKTYVAYQGTSKETKLYVTTIGKNAYKNSKIKTLTIPDTVTEIKDGAFAGSKIKNIIIPKSVKKIGKNAFKGCKNLKSITFKGKTTLVKKSGIAKTVKVTVPKKFKKIYQCALKGYKIK